MSNLGNIRSMNYNNTNTVKNMSWCINNSGYKTVCLRFNNIKKTLYYHILVINNFIGYDENKIVNHKDGNKLNNAISNLEYVTQSENRQHADKLNLVKYRRGSDNGSSTITEEIAINIFKEVGTIREISTKYNIKYMHVWKIKNQVIWKHIHY